MSAYLFSGLVNQYHKGRFVEACVNLLLYGADETASWKAFEQILLSPAGDEDPNIPRKIERMVGAPVLNELLGETGNKPLDWPELVQEIQHVLESTAVDDESQGYWADCDQLVRPDNLAPAIDWLQRELPEEIRSGLNWSADKNYFFLITVLSPPPAPAGLAQPEAEPEELRTREELSEEEEALNDSAVSDAEQRLLTFPQLADKELAAVVRARNSVVATWLWRKYGASTPLARNAIRVDPLCEVVSLGAQAPQ